MRNRSGILRLTAVSLCCLAILVTSGYRYLFRAAQSDADTPFSLTSSAQTVLVSPQTDGGSAVSAESSSQTAASDGESAVQAAASGEAAGKVVSKFITPYTANTVYDSIYLKNSTDLEIDLKALYEAPLPYHVEKDGAPQILIMHTHTTESFLHETRDYYTDADDARSLDETYNMVRLGNIVAEKLNATGIKTLHDTTLHDYPSYNDSYTRAAETIRGYLKKYPSIKIVLDLHRDAIAGEGTDKVKPVVEINGQKAAQVMIVMGSQSGSVTNFENWQENLKLAVKLQRQLEGMYPTLARALSLMPRKYNENLTTGSMLIEIGTEVNSIDEVSYSAELLGNALAALLG